MVALRLFQGDEFEPAPGWNLPAGAERTLQDYYVEEMLPARRLALAAKTLESDRTALNRWRRFSGSEPKTWGVDDWGRRTWTPASSVSIRDPPIGYLVDADLVRFVASMAADGLKSTTVGITVRHLRTILAHAYREGDGCLLRLPRFPRLAVAVGRKWIPKPDEVRAVFAAAGGLPEAAHVRALMVLGGVYGIDPHDLCGLRWESAFSRDLSRLTWTRSKTKRTRPDEMDCPVPEWIRSYLAAVQKPSGLLFRRTYEVQRLWRYRLAPLANLQQGDQDAAGRSYLRFTLKSLRKFANARANGICQGAGNWLLGHAAAKDQQVNARHYSDAFVAPVFVVEVLENPQLSEPFRL
jgi:hypothetical protein